MTTLNDTGKVPTAMFSLPKLEELRISDAQVPGEAPGQYVKFTQGFIPRVG